ncbi:MAG TPA: hypothetical protein VL727_23545 [Puia sp.]|nr:hypothetical protein [Puia sp.]
MNLTKGRELIPDKKRAILFALLSIVVSYGLLSLRFSLRNDQNIYTLPVRMYMSDAFRHHEFMFWVPFLSGGYPIHSDIQGPVWNPIAVSLSWLFHYNSSTLSLELLLYFLIGTTGCFYFASDFSRNLYSCAVIAIIYGCSGFGTSALEFMGWVGSFAFLPWAFHYFYHVLKRPGFYSSARCSVSLWFLLVCGYPSFIIYLGYILLAATLLYFYLLYVQKRMAEIPAILGSGVLCVLLFVLLSLPAIHSFIEYLPYYARGTRAFDSQLNGEFFSWNYLLSLLIPVAGMRDWGNELYIGLIPVLLLCSGVGMRRAMGYRDWFVLAGILFTGLFAIGRSTPIRMWAAKNLPLLGAFGFSHCAGIFLTLGLLVWLAPRLDNLFSDGMRSEVKRLRLAGCAAGVILVICIIAERWIPFTVVRSSPIAFYFYYVSAVWQLLLVAGLLLFKDLYRSRGRLFLLILADLVVSVLLVAPLTGFGLTRPRVYNTFAEHFYAFNANEQLMIPAAGREKLPVEDHSDVNAVKLILPARFPSNTRLDTFCRFVSDSGRYRELLEKPFVFSDDGTVLNVSHIELGYNYIHIDVRAEDSSQLVVQQTYHKRWRAERPEYNPLVWRGIYLQVPLKRGENRVRLYYYKRDLVIEAVISLGSLIVLAGILFGYYRRGRMRRG